MVYTGKQWRRRKNCVVFAYSFLFWRCISDRGSRSVSASLTPFQTPHQSLHFQLSHSVTSMIIIWTLLYFFSYRTLPNVRHLAEDTKGVDKLIVLNNIIARHTLKKYRTLVFCNTVKSCRCVLLLTSLALSRHSIPLHALPCYALSCLVLSCHPKL